MNHIAGVFLEDIEPKHVSWSFYDDLGVKRPGEGICDFRGKLYHFAIESFPFSLEDTLTYVLTDYDSLSWWEKLLWKFRTSFNLRGKE